MSDAVIMFCVLQTDLKLVLFSVNEVASDNLSAVTRHCQPLTRSSDGLLYAFDATTYRHTLHDVTACKTALLKMKRLLQQVRYFENHVSVIIISASLKLQLKHKHY